MLSGQEVKGTRGYEHPNSALQQVAAQKSHLSPAPAPLKMAHWTSSQQQQEKWPLQGSWEAAHGGFRSSVACGGAGGAGVGVVGVAADADADAGAVVA